MSADGYSSNSWVAGEDKIAISFVFAGIDYESSVRYNNNTLKFIGGYQPGMSLRPEKTGNFLSNRT
jgi:hypothetical protein